MNQEFVQMLIANLPNMGGLLVLAYVQWSYMKQAQKNEEECEKRYENLVNRLLDDKPASDD